MPTKTRKPKPITLDFRSQQSVVVVPDDEDRFVTTSCQAAKACKQEADSEEWDKQWDDFLFHIHKWCERNATFVQAGYVSVGDTGLNVLICTKSQDYDFSIADDIVTLDVELAQHFPACPADVMQVPDQKALKVELPSEAVLVYGDGKRSSKEGGTQPAISADD